MAKKQNGRPGVGAVLKGMWDRVPTVGTGHFQSWIRAGFKEASRLLMAFPEKPSIVEEQGLVGNPQVFSTRAERKAANSFEARLEEARTRAKIQEALQSEKHQDKGLER